MIVTPDLSRTGTSEIRSIVPHCDRRHTTQYLTPRQGCALMESMETNTNTSNVHLEVTDPALIGGTTEVQITDTKSGRRLVVQHDVRHNDDPNEDYGFGTLRMGGLSAQAWTNHGGFTQVSIHPRGHVTTTTCSHTGEVAACDLKVVNFRVEQENGPSHTIAFFGVTREQLIKALQESRPY